MLNRRHWLAQSLSGAGVLSLASAGLLVSSKRAGAAEGAVQLIPNLERDLYRVRMEMDLEGNVNVPSNPLVSRKSETKLPVKSSAVFDYEERFRRPSAADQRTEVTTSERYYHEAKSSSRLDRTEQTQTLRESVKHAVVRRDVLPETIYAVNDYLTQQEVDLLRVPTSSVMVDRVLPQVAVVAGQKYEVDRQALVSLLNLASIEESDVLGEVMEISAEAAKIQLRGKISGSADGVPTVVRVVGKLTFDRKIGNCTWLAMAVHETREIGKAEPGFDISATIKMVRQPLQRPVALPVQPVPLAITSPIPADRLYIEITSKELGVTTLMDRRWRMMNDVPGSSMMRMIDNDRSIAQCDLRPLADLKAGTQWTMEAFQSDVTRTLGKQMTQLIEADERVSDSGLRVLRVTAAGAVQGVPIQWVMMHFSDDSGRRLLATFTMDGPSIEAFAGSDVQLANSLRLLTPDHSTPESSAPKSSAQASDDKMNVKKSDRVQSASDLRRSTDRR